MHLPPPLSVPQHTAGSKTYLFSSAWHLPISLLRTDAIGCNPACSLHHSLPSSLPPPTFSFSSRLTHLWLFLPQTITPAFFFLLFVSLHLLDCPKFILSLSLALSADLILCPRMAEDAVFRWTFAAEPDKAHTVLERDAGYLQ